jgi:signal transduction histidine kinase/CheY-like chemotaxis protein
MTPPQRQRSEPAGSGNLQTTSWLLWCRRRKPAQRKPMSPVRTKFSAFSFRAILFTIAIVGTLPTIAFSGWLLTRYAQSERERAERTLVESTRGIARGIDGLFKEAEAALLALRDSGLFDSDNLAEIESQLRRTAAAIGRPLALIDPGGRQIINTFLPVGQPLPQQQLQRWARVFTDRRTIVTDVFEGLTSRQLLAGVATPVFRNDEVKWALAVGLFPKDFAEVMRDPGVPTDWVVSIVDRTGRHMMRSHRNDEFAGTPLVPVLVDLMKAGGTGPLRTVSLEGIPLISTVQYAEMSRWAAAVGLPVTALEAPMWGSLNDLMIAGALVAGAALLLALAMAHVLDRAMLSLTGAALEIGAGKEIDVPRSTVKDVNVVGRVLARTSRDLRALRTTLESQVAERTAELSAANVKLTEEIKLRQDTEAQVMQMRKIEAIGQLTGGIAHDFNNMLAIIISSLRLLQRRLDRGDTNVQKYIDGAVEGAERAANLTSRLLAFSRQQPLAPEVIDGNKLIAGMGEILRRTIPESVRIETVLAGGLWRTYADVQGLESAIINLAVNGRDAMPDGGKLTIETANVVLDEAYAGAHPDIKPGQYVMIAVTDTGTGMPPDVLGQAFEPFFTTKPAGQGTGLGLSQVHGFIKQSGGHIAIYSEPGHGTTVKIYLPRRLDATETAGLKRPATSEVLMSRRGETILVVEDEADVRRVTVEMLKELGYATLEAENAEQALARIDVHPEIALLLTDVVMPGQNGRQLADEALRRRPGLPVLFTTGYTRNAIVHHGILDPDVHVLIKPHTLEMLAMKLSDLLYAKVAADAGGA